MSPKLVLENREVQVRPAQNSFGFRFPRDDVLPDTGHHLFIRLNGNRELEFDQAVFDYLGVPVSGSLGIGSGV